MGVDCGPGATVPPGLVVVSCVRASAGVPLDRIELFRTMLPSFRETVSQAELRSLPGPACLYLCADAGNELLMDRVKELRRLAQTRANGLGVRVFFYPYRTSGLARSLPFREAMLQAYADGARYLHHTFDDVA